MMECGVMIMWLIGIVICNTNTEYNMTGREQKVHKELWNLEDGIW